MTNHSLPKSQLAAWLVHLYTASGGIVGMAALFFAATGQTRTAFLLLIVTFLIDGTDGIMARRARVSKVLPQFSGAEVDNIVDFLTYIWVPIFIMWHEQLLPSPLWLAVPILAGLYAYGQVDMKTEDDFFLGFPSYWNVVAFYLFALRPEPFWAVFLVVLPAVLTFVPTRYLYPSKNEILWRTSWLLGGIWFLMIVAIVVDEAAPSWLVWLSLFYPVYYMGVSFYIDWNIRRGKPLKSL